MSLPVELSQYGFLIDKFFIANASKGEYHGPCPRCGGRDRFAIFTDREYPEWNCWCRVCSPANTWLYEWAPALRREFTEEEKQAWAERKRQSELERALAKAAKLAEFTSQELWEELHRRVELDGKHRAWWESQGIPREWQDYLKLGYTPDKVYMGSDKQLKHSPAYTIPYFGERFTFRTLQYRLVSPEDPSDRYRFESGLEASYYMTTPSLPIASRVVVCEGAKKGVVTRILGWDEANMDKISVLAIPAKNAWQHSGILEAVAHCDRVYICLDPDCWIEPKGAPDNWKPEPVRFAQAVGKSARIVEMPIKIDDAFLKYGMAQSAWADSLRLAARVM